MAIRLTGRMNLGKLTVHNPPNIKLRSKLFIRGPRGEVILAVKGDTLKNLSFLNLLS